VFAGMALVRVGKAPAKSPSTARVAEA